MMKIRFSREHKALASITVFLTLIVVLAFVLVPGVRVKAGNQYLSISLNSEITAQTIKTDPQSAQARYVGETSVQQTAWGYRYTLSNGDIVEVGDSTTPDFKASVKTIRWDGVASFSLGSAGGTYTPTLNGLEISFQFNSDTLVKIYPVEPSTRLPEGGIEYDITLLRRPAQNSVTLDIDWQGITWQKILPLNVEYNEARSADVFGAQGSPYVLTATTIVGADGITYKTRPEYEVNSYLGTATSPYKDTEVIGWNPSTQQPITYTKVSRTYLYIHRGEMTDALGNKVWVEDLNLDEAKKQITFTLPRTWLRDAIYPISRVAGVDPAYTQKMGSFQSTALAFDGVWGDIDLTTLAGDSVVAEIILSNATAGTENTLGVRANGSSLGRFLYLHEAEGGGQTHARMFVNTDASGIIEAYHSDVSDADYFYVVGYWTNVTFTEHGTTPTYYNANSVDAWDTEDVTTAAANVVAHFVLANDEADIANTMGIRAVGSSLERKLVVHEPESGGTSFLDMFVKLDANQDCQLYSSDTLNTRFYILGYFGSEMDFVEKWQNIPLTTTTWEAEDLTAYLDQDGRMVDFLLVHSNEVTAGITMGVRGGDDAVTERKLVEHEAESAGAGGEYTGFSMSAQSNASGVVNLIASNAEEGIYLTGYFKPSAAFNISNDPSSKAFGIVAAGSTYYAKGSAPSNPLQDSEATFTITNNGIQADLDMKITDFTGGVGWNIVSSAPGSNEVRITAYYSGQNPALGLVLANTDAEFLDAFAASSTKKWDFKFETGTFTDGVAKSATLTITARAET